jgi:transposase
LEDQPVPDVSSIAPTDVRLWVALDVHKLSIVAATLPPAGGKPQVCRIETTEKAIRRLIDRLGGPDGLALCYEAGPGGVALWRLLRTMGVACDIVAPSLVAVRAGDRVKTDRRDATKPVALHRSGLLSYVQAPTPETEGLRDLAGRPARPLRRTPPVLCDPDSRPQPEAAHDRTLSCGPDPRISE